MEEQYLIGEWSNKTNTFWFGANDCEWMAWKGSHQIFIYPCSEHPQPPSGVIQSTKRIETLEDFSETIWNGIRYDATYTEPKIEKKLV